MNECNHNYIEQEPFLICINCGEEIESMFSCIRKPPCFNSDENLKILKRNKYQRKYTQKDSFVKLLDTICLKKDVFLFPYVKGNWNNQEELKQLMIEQKIENKYFNLINSMVYFKNKKEFIDYPYFEILNIYDSIEKKIEELRINKIKINNLILLNLILEKLNFKSYLKEVKNKRKFNLQKELILTLIPI